MDLLNHKGERVNIHHYCGRRNPNRIRFMKEYLWWCLRNNIELPSNLTLVTVATDAANSILCQAMAEKGIPYINAFKENDLWENNISKLRLIYNCLKSDDIKTDYVLILDSLDVVVENFKGIMEKFESYDCDILFGASHIKFPNRDVEEIVDKEEKMGPFCYLNSGCIIGKKGSLIDFYKESIEMADIVEDNPWKSDQYIIRHVFAKTSKDLFNGAHRRVMLDNECKIFLNNCNMAFPLACDYHATLQCRKENNNFKIIANKYFKKW